MSGNVNIYTTRRVGFEKCYYWELTTYDGSVPLSVIAYQNKPSGFFYAELQRDISTNTGNLADIRYTKNTVALSTCDNVYDKLKKNYLVKFHNRIWRIQSITFTEDWRNSQFNNSKNKIGVTNIVLVS